MHVYYFQDFSIFSSETIDFDKKKNSDSFFYGLTNFKRVKSKLISDYSDWSISVMFIFLFLCV